MKKLKFLMAPILAMGMIFGIGVGHVFAEVSTVEVEKGDTLWSISKDHDVSIYDLYEWNFGIDPYNLQIGMEVIVDPGSDWYHTVAPGDTFYNIAAKYEGLTVGDLYIMNPILDPYNLQIGSKVKIQAAEYGIEYHTVEPGETLFWIAFMNPNVTLADLYQLNPGIDPYHLQIGSKIRVK